MSEKYRQNQTDALTHDITEIYECKAEYVGDAPNTGKLIGKLPLGNVQRFIQIESNPIGLTVNYLDTIWNIGREKVKRDMVYNSIAIMACIDNISFVTYEFSGDTYTFTREDFENEYACKLSELLDEENGSWKERVQDMMTNEEYLNTFYHDCDPLTD